MRKVVLATLCRVCVKGSIRDVAEIACEPRLRCVLVIGVALALERSFR